MAENETSESVGVRGCIEYQWNKKTLLFAEGAP
jgi:hypothetical protein